MSSASGGRPLLRAASAAMLAAALAVAAACSAPHPAGSGNASRGRDPAGGSRSTPARVSAMENLLAALEVNGYREFAEDLQRKKCESVNCTLYEYGGTLLHEAAASSDTALVILLLEHGARVDAPDREGWTPLMYCADSCSPEAAKLLLDRGADAGIVNHEGTRAADIAKESECGEVGELLRGR